MASGKALIQPLHFISCLQTAHLPGKTLISSFLKTRLYIVYFTFP